MMGHMAQHQPTPQPAARPAPTKKRKTARDMALSLAVIMVPILLITWLFTNNLPDYPVQPVDDEYIIETARSEAPYPVFVPQNLPRGEGGWTVTQASWVAEGTAARDGEYSPTNEWLWGALDPNEVYYAVNQSDGLPADLVATVSRDGYSDGTSVVAGGEWERWISPDERTRVLVREEEDYTLTVTADATYEGLEALASTLDAG